MDSILAETAKKYGRTFDLMEKIKVTGAGALPLYKEMLDPEQNLITWNFHKFLIDRDGALVGSYKPKVSPLQMEDEIKQLLAQKQ